MDRLDGLCQSFSDYLDQRGIRLAAPAQVDLLASCLGSQFLLFAGPSGTGKSTAAAALAGFFGEKTRYARIDVEAGWSATSDLVGYYSGITLHYLPGPYLSALLQLEAAPAARSPFIVLEEANLSPVEAYLTRPLQELSATHLETLELVLHDAGDAETPDGQDVPRKIEIGPFPRLLGTINVDAEAPAPARKVSGRACVVLLEAPPDPDPGALVDSLFAADHEIVHTLPELPGDPRSALAHYQGLGELDRIASPLRQTLAALGGNPGGRATQRDVLRSLAYNAFFTELAQQAPLSLPPDAAALSGAYNALLHFVLPGLPPTAFRDAVAALEGRAPTESVLPSRLASLKSRFDDDAFAPVDFWSCLT